MTEHRLTFNNHGDFEAMYAAERWCEERGIAVGSSQRGAPRGLMFGFYRIAKWRNLNDSERRQLDGRMTGDMRNGPVTIVMNRPLDSYAVLEPETGEHGAGATP